LITVTIAWSHQPPAALPQSRPVETQVSRRQSWKSSVDGAEGRAPLACPGVTCGVTTIRSGFAYGGGCSSSELTMLKIAVFGPMPRARAMTAMAVTPGWEAPASS
jgi:hypothetical protein